MVVDSGVGIAFCCWWVVAWTAGLGLRVGVAFCCRGVGAAGLALRVGSARRECVLLLTGARVGSAGLALGVGIALVVCDRAGLQDCKIAGLRFLLRNSSRIAGLGGEEQRGWGRGSGVREDCVVNKKKIEKHQNLRK